jgi:hypothetical protein
MQLTRDELKESVLNSLGNQDQKHQFSKLITYSALSTMFLGVAFAGYYSGHAVAQAECIHGQSMNRSMHAKHIQDNPDLAAMHDFNGY